VFETVLVQACGCGKKHFCSSRSKAQSMDPGLRRGGTKPRIIAFAGPSLTVRAGVLETALSAFHVSEAIRKQTKEPRDPSRRRSRSGRSNRKSCWRAVSHPQQTFCGQTKVKS
jgi:hypothetical protein